MKTQRIIKDNRTLDILYQVKKEAKEVLGEDLEEIILYGSYARNDQDGESDIDIMILVKGDEKLIAKYDDKFTDMMFELSLKYDLLLSIMLKNSEQFNKYLEVLPFYTNVRNEGIKIYG